MGYGGAGYGGSSCGGGYYPGYSPFIIFLVLILLLGLNWGVQIAPGPFPYDVKE